MDITCRIRTNRFGYLVRSVPVYFLDFASGHGVWFGIQF
eukprot:UN01201